MTEASPPDRRPTAASEPLSPASRPAWSPPWVVVRLGRAARAAAVEWRLALALYLPTLLLALVAAAPIFVGSLALATLGRWAALLAQGDHLEVLLEAANALAATDALPGEAPPTALATAGLGLVLAIVLAFSAWLVQGLAYTFVAGGILDRLAARPPRRAGPAERSNPRGESFWTACRRWFWPMIRFGLLAGVIWAALGGLGVAAIGLIGETTATTLPLKALAALAWLGCCNGLLELGRAHLVLGSDRSAGRALGRALRAPVRPRFFLGAVLLWLILAAAGLAFARVAAGLAVAIPATSILVAFVVQQVAALIGAWLKLLRLALAVELAAAWVRERNSGEPTRAAAEQ